MKRRTRFVSLLLAASMALSLFPVSAFADNTGGGVGSTTQQAADAYPIDITGKTGPLTIKANTDGTYTITKGDLENGGSTETVTADSITVTGTAALGTANTGLALSIDGTAAAAKVTLDSAEIDNSATMRNPTGIPGIAVTGAVNLTLGTGKSVLKGGYDCAGLQKDDDGQLTIYGPGELQAIGGDYGAGIGGGERREGTNITIEGGTVIANGGRNSAGIGGGDHVDGSNITINSGTVTATGGKYGGAGIGGGSYGDGNHITIDNGNVSASTNNIDGDGAGIGGGSYGDGSHITINGGTVTATSLQRGAGIGGGMKGKGTDISITDGSVTIRGRVGIGGGAQTLSDLECGEGSKIKLTGGSVKISNCAVGIGGMYCTSACEDIEISNCDLSIAASDVGIGAYYPYVPSKNISIKENAAVTISGIYSGPYRYIGDYGSSDYDNYTDVQDLSREATAGLTTGHVYGYKSSQNPDDASVYPDLVLPQYGIKVNDLDVDFYNKANILNILKKKSTSSAAAPVVAYDPAAKKLTGNGSFENATTIAVTDGYTQTNGDLTNKLQVELNNTNTDASGAYTMGKLTVTGAKDVTVNNNANYKVTLNDADITPLDQPLSYTKDTAGGTLVVEKAYIISVTGGKAYNNEGKQIAYAEPGDAVIIQADAPAAPADPAAADAPDAIFANWETDNDLTINDDTTGSKVNGSAKRVLVFTMPAALVKINAVNQYKLTVTGGKAYDAADTTDKPVALRYAKADTEIRLVADADNADKGIQFASWKTDSFANLSIVRVNGCQDRETTFTMPADAVTVSVSSKTTSVTPRAYRVQVQLPADVAFEDGAAPVTVSVPDTTGTEEDPKPDRNSTTALGAAPEQLVTLKFDTTTLPKGYSFGQWVVTQLLPEQTTVPVEKGTSDLEATFSMPASPVTVTFTVNAPEPEPEPSGDGGAGAAIAGVLIGGTAYLLGTRAWLEGTYGYVPANRMELALGLWKRADCPAPESTELYADIEQNDADAQAAARWCVEQGLLKDYRKQNDDGTETVTFKPGRYVARPYALTRWYKLEKLLSEQ